MRWITDRARHGHETIFRPMWSWGWVAGVSFISGLAWWRDEFAPPALSQRLKAVTLLPTWGWEAWALVWAAALLLVLFEGSFSVRRRLERERGDARAALAAIVQERPLMFSASELVLTPVKKTGSKSDYVIGFKLVLKNAGRQRIAYSVLWLRLDAGGVAAVFPPPVSNRGILAPEDDVIYDSGVATNPIPVKSINSPIIVDFEIEYDNVPPANRRTIGARLLVTSDFRIPGQFSFKFLEQRES